MAQTLYKIYTNDQPIRKYTEHFIYVDNLAVMLQGENFETVENKI